MALDLIIAGAGIGGLSLAVAQSRLSAQPIRVLEKTAVLSEVGAGLQLGPNAVRHLIAWGLGPALKRVAFEPRRLQVHSLLSGAVLAELALADQGRAQQIYGAPYWCLRRADLQQALLQAVQASGQVDLQLDQAWQADPQARPGDQGEAPLLIGADGLWSPVRAWASPEVAAPQASGHVAWRALLPQITLPVALRSDCVRVWMGPRCHVVAYPVAAGEQLNLVAISNQTQEPAPIGTEDFWDQSTDLDWVRQSLLPQAPPSLRPLLEAVPAWRQWPLFERPPLGSAAEMARGRVALLGDAAHPMRPYLAQGAAMAIEDAAELAACLSQQSDASALSRYAQRRWQRCARVQRASLRNGRIFHASGPFGLVQKARDASLRLLGPSLLDPAWLYGGGPALSA